MGGEVIEPEPVSVSLERMGCNVEIDIDHNPADSVAWVFFPDKVNRFVAYDHVEAADPEMAVEGAPLFAGNGHDAEPADVPSQLVMTEVS